jgi:MinD-like ATPase involved in chromosome partitioning or flagellar assembly
MPAVGRPPTLERDAFFPRDVVDGRVAREAPGARLWHRARFNLMGDLARRERLLDGRLAQHEGGRRVNTVAVISPKGGVGKTTLTFALGNLLATELRARVIAIDANPDFGTLGSLAPERAASDRNLVDVLAEMPRIDNVAQLRPYVSMLSSGLHILAAPAQAQVMAQVTPDVYGRLCDFLGQFYELILLDLGTGILDPIARYCVERADQRVVVATQEFVTTTSVLRALKHLPDEDVHLVLNQAYELNPADRAAVEAAFTREGLPVAATIPYDDHLRAMIDTGTYRLDALGREVRVPIKQLGLRVADSLR